MKKEEQSAGNDNPDAKCLKCADKTPLPYWCETCRQLVPEKRCPKCGLKARKVRPQ